MLVQKARGQDKVGKIILTPSELAVLKKKGIPVEFYVAQQLVFIAKKRRWKWYFNKDKK